LATTTKDENTKRPGFFSRISRSVKDMRGELKRVVWPTKNQVVNNTIVVLGFMLISALVIGGFDFCLSLLRQLFFGAGA